jgi:hypothetical protein
MKSLFLLFLVSSPLVLGAQTLAELTAPGQQIASLLGDEAVSAVASEASPSAEPSAAQQQSARSSPAPQPTPRIPGSMVGYIDNPIVESEIRFRFDDDFEDQFPDRSEFIYAKCGCFQGLQNLIPPALDTKAVGPGPGVPRAINYQQLYIDGEYSPQRRFSGFVEVPFRWLQPQGFLSIPPFPGFPHESGISDVMAGLKFAAVASERTYVTFQFKTYIPSGNASEGLGTHHYSVEPSLLFYQNLSSRFTLEGQLGDWHPIGGSPGVPITSNEGFAGDVFFYGIGPSYKVYNGERVKLAPVVEVFGWHVLSGFQTQPVTGAIDGAASDVSGMNIVNLKAGLRVAIGNRNSFYVGFGQALTHDDWYKHIIRLEYRYTF